MGLATAILTKRNSLLISIAQKNCEMSEWAVKTLRKLVDFQAENDGSIPFIRSCVFNGLRATFFKA